MLASWLYPQKGDMRRVCEAIGWILILIIVVLSLVPPTYRPMTPASHNFEHAAIYLFTGTAFGAAYSARLTMVTTGLVLFSGLIEIAQFMSPGRHARLLDFIVDAIAACIGATVVAMTVKWFAPPLKPS